MRAVLFDNKLLVPKKCGSTYSYNIFTDVVSTEYDIEHLYSIKNTITIVIREPIEHLQSALHTELLGWLFDNPIGILIITNTFISFGRLQKNKIKLYT